MISETGPSSFEVGLKMLMSMPTTKDLKKVVSRKKKGKLWRSYLFRPLVKSAYQKNLISQPKHMLWELKMSTKTYVQTDELENIFKFYAQNF